MYRALDAAPELTMRRQRLPVHNSPSPAPVLLAPGPGAEPSSGRASPYRPNSSLSQYSESPYGGGMSSGAGGGGMGGYSGTTQQIEGQNDERLSGLLGKVKSLKDVSEICWNCVRRSCLRLGLGES
jgi:blocked-early-in-transport protein 1